MSKELTREIIASDVNCVDNLARTIILDQKLNLKEGDIYDNRGKIESWSGSDCTMSFISEIEGKYEYVFLCDNVPCHKVDYDNYEECEVLGAVDCESEGEVLVLPSVKMRIAHVPTDEDYKEMGYYEVHLELVEE